MKIGIPREIKAQEQRVSMLPAGVLQLVKNGHTVFVESNAATSIGYTDEQYEAVGATIINSHQEVFELSEMIVKVKEPQESEYSLLTPDKILVTYLHLAASKSLTKKLIASGILGIAYETVQIGRRLPLLEPMSEIAGRIATVSGSHYLSKHYGGNGTFIGGLPGVLPGSVLILGGGAAGTNAARMALGLGADVTILEINTERMRYLEHTMHGIRTLYSKELYVTDLLSKADLLIGSVLVPGEKAPKLVNRELLRKMKKGSVFVDISVDQGGCSETTRPTTHENPIYTEEGIIHYCVANMPGAYAKTSTQALVNATFPYVELIANFGIKEACKKSPELIKGINVYNKVLTNAPIGKAHGLNYIEPEVALQMLN